MPIEFVHTTIGVTFLAVLAMISQIVVGDSGDKFKDDSA